VSFFGLSSQTFTGNNSYTGTTTITEPNYAGTPGVLTSTESGATGTTPFGTGAIVFNGGTLAIAPSAATGAIADTGVNVATGTSLPMAEVTCLV